MGMKRTALIEARIEFPAHWSDADCLDWLRTRLLDNQSESVQIKEWVKAEVDERQEELPL